jgi:hypothetical protein
MTENGDVCTWTGMNSSLDYLVARVNLSVPSEVYRLDAIVHYGKVVKST